MLELDYILKESHYIDTREFRAIYFLLYNNEIVYIGSADKVKARLRQHRSKRKILFNRYYILPYDSGCVRKKEKEYIIKYKPKYNLQWNPDFERGKNMVWFNFVAYYGNYSKLSRAVNIDSQICRSIVLGLRGKQDKYYMKVRDHLLSLRKQDNVKHFKINKELQKLWVKNGS